jgi:hypothetical protein
MSAASWPLPVRALLAYLGVSLLGLLAPLWALVGMLYLFWQRRSSRQVARVLADATTH